MDTFVQATILLTSAAAIWLVNQTGPIKRWACIVGLLGQPLWFYTAIKAGQWGIVALSCWYTLAWLQGIAAYWIRPAQEEKCS